MKKQSVKPAVKPIRDDLDMMNRPDDWPVWPFLPLKRSHEQHPDLYYYYGVLCVTAKPVPPTVYIMNIWHQQPLKECKKLDYPSMQAILDDGWIVD